MRVVPTELPERARHRARRLSRRPRLLPRDLPRRAGIATHGIDGPFVQDNHSRSVARHAARPAPAAAAAAGQADARDRGRDLRRRRRRPPRLADVRPMGRRRRCRPRTSSSATSRPASRTASACSAPVAQVEYKCTDSTTRRARSASPGTIPPSRITWPVADAHALRRATVAIPTLDAIDGCPVFGHRSVIRGDEVVASLQGLVPRKQADFPTNSARHAALRLQGAGRWSDYGRAP